MINKSIIGVLLILIALAGIAFAGIKTYEIAYTAYANEPLGTDKERGIELVVEEGSSYTDVAKTLKEKELLDSTLPFVLRASFSEYRNSLKAGTYEIHETMGIYDILVVITQSEA